jgi:hypothetical protein
MQEAVLENRRLIALGWVRQQQRATNAPQEDQTVANKRQWLENAAS